MDPRLRLYYTIHRLRRSEAELCTRKMGRMIDTFDLTFDLVSAVCWIVFCYDLFDVFLYLCS
jgi:hypothetical protein